MLARWREVRDADPGGQMFVTYYYAWTPLVILGTLVVLTLPWLGLIALMVVSLLALGALAAIASAIVLVPYALARAVARRGHGDGGASVRTVAAPSPARRKSA
jgi:hypothetical protein